MPEVQRISSRDNPLLVKVRKLAHDPVAYRKVGLVWIEGEHLCEAALAQGLQPVQALVTESEWEVPAVRALARAAARVAVLPQALFKGISALETPSGVGLLIAREEAPAVVPGVHSVVLDRIQDPGNAGSILRSAAAFGVAQVVALPGTAALWSPKVLRAGMGAHFALRLVEAVGPDALDALALPLVGTSPRAAHLLRNAALPHPCAWLFGHEGQGMASALAARCAWTVQIPQPGGQESLNVAAAAAICLYESSLSPAG
jgi:RNA methyltransferase, TrmH family